MGSGSEVWTYLQPTVLDTRYKTGHDRRGEGLGCLGERLGMGTQGGLWVY